MLYIGIADDGTVIGVSDADSLQKKVAERIRDNILPSALGLYDVTSEEMDGKTVIQVIVSSGTEKPYYIKEKGMPSAGCFIRVGTTVQPMSTSMIDTSIRGGCAIRRCATFPLPDRISPSRSSKFIMRSADSL